MDATTLAILSTSLVGAITAFFAGIVLVIKALGEVKQGNLKNQEAIEKVDTKVDTVKAQTDGILSAAKEHATELGQLREKVEQAKIAVVKAEEREKTATALAQRESDKAVAAAEERTPKGLLQPEAAVATESTQKDIATETARGADEMARVADETKRVADAQEAALPNQAAK